MYAINQLYSHHAFVFFAQFNIDVCVYIHNVNMHQQLTLTTMSTKSIYSTIDQEVVSLDVYKVYTYTICDKAMSFLNQTYEKKKKKGQVCVWAQWPIRPALISSSQSIKRLAVFLLPPERDASPFQDYHQVLNLPVFIYTPGWRDAMSE